MHNWPNAHPRLDSILELCRAFPIADKRWLSHDMCLYQVMMTLHFLNDVANDPELTQKIDNYVIIASLKSKAMDKLINRIPLSNRSASFAIQQASSRPCLVNLKSKDTHLVFFKYI